jgi:hypothetical protein
LPGIAVQIDDQQSRIFSMPPDAQQHDPAPGQFPAQLLRFHRRVHAGSGRRDQRRQKVVPAPLASPIMGDRGIWCNPVT